MNLSARELADAGLAEAISAAVTGNGLQPRQLGLEIVEEALGDPDTLERLADYHRRGHPLSVDDFGTGYSSLSRLLDLPVESAKIDKSFVAGLPTDSRRSRLIDAVVLMASHLDLQVVAEGVETEAQAAHLSAAGCDLLQGHLLARPQSAARLTASWQA